MFRKSEKRSLSVSELSLYFSCPRKLYYSCRGYVPFSSSSITYIEHIILKEMAMSYSHMLKHTSAKDDAGLNDMEVLLSDVLGNIGLIYPAEMEVVTAETLREVSDNLRVYFPSILLALNEQAKVPEFQMLAEKILVQDSEPFLHSDKLNLTGAPYRIIENDKSFEPVIIKTGAMPENGVWLNDRLHLASFAMLSEETYGSPVKTGHVLYARTGIFRNVNIRSNDRRQVLQAIGRAGKIKDGTMPYKKESPLCDTCIYSEMCNVKASFASKFF